MKRHHGQMHDGTIAGLPIVCDVCGTEGRRKRSEVEKYDGTFCSDKCHNIGQRVYSEADLIEQLQVYHAEHGRIHWDDMTSQEGVAAHRIFSERFDSLASAKEAAGIGEYKRCPDCGVAQERLSRHWRETACSPPLTDRQRQIITGLVMGDASALPHGAGYYIQAVGASNPFMQWIDDELGVWSVGVRDGATGDDLLRRSLKHGDRIVTEASTFRDQYTVQTVTHPVFGEWRDWYDSGEKRFPDNLELTPLIANVWYACDGGLKWSKTDGRRYCTVAYTVANEADRIETIAELFEAVGFSANSHGNTVSIPMGETDSFLSWLSDPIDGYAYKYHTTDYDEYQQLKPDSLGRQDDADSAN